MRVTTKTSFDAIQTKQLFTLLYKLDDHFDERNATAKQSAVSEAIRLLNAAGIIESKS